jgi:hypothetical protein
MRFLTTLTLAAVLLSGTRLEAQTESATKSASANQGQPATHVMQPATKADFGPLEFLVGHCWIGNFPDGKSTDEHCFEWVFDRKFIRDHHVVRGGAPYEGESLYGWDPVAKRLGLWYWNSDGEILQGHVEYKPEGIVFPLAYTTPSGTVQLRAIWTRTDEGYHIVHSQLANGQWKTQWTMDMKQTR